MQRSIRHSKRNTIYFPQRTAKLQRMPSQTAHHPYLKQLLPGCSTLDKIYARDPEDNENKQLYVDQCPSSPVSTNALGPFSSLQQLSSQILLIWGKWAWTYFHGIQEEVASKILQVMLLMWTGHIQSGEVSLQMNTLAQKLWDFYALLDFSRFLLLIKLTLCYHVTTL